jgi:competence ComEA-like helix-hairpin-helix protein
MRTHLPPLLANRNPLIKVVLAAVVPAAFGLLAGVMLGVSGPAYQAIALLGIAGGYAAGLEHLGARDGWKRGLVGGSLFGIWILIAHGALFDAEPKAHLPEPQIVLVALTTAFGCALGALGGRHRARLERAGPGEAAVPTVKTPAAKPWNAIVDLNGATIDELTMLPVVGRGAAERIAAHRERNGPFARIEDLVEVEGFNASRVSRLAPRATV